MEKFFWNVTGLALLIANIFLLAYCFVEQTTFSGIAILVAAVVDMAYAEKRPTYIDK